MASCAIKYRHLDSRCFQSLSLGWAHAGCDISISPLYSLAITTDVRNRKMFTIRTSPECAAQ
jgi:hypothetical protein